MIYDRKMETMSRAEMRALQLQRLQEIVKYAYENVPVYKKKYDEVGVKPEDIKTILEAKDRSKAGATAPACGLYLSKVVY